MIFSTSSSVDVYLKEVHNIKCQCLSKFLNEDEIKKAMDYTTAVIDEILLALDNTVSAEINKAYGLDMNFFSALYSYSGKHHFAEYYFFIISLKHFIELHKPDEPNEIIIYNFDFSATFPGISTDMAYIINQLSQLFGGYDIKIISYHNIKRRQRNYFKELSIVFRRLKKMPLYMINRLIYVLSSSLRHKGFSAKKKTILLSEPLYEIEFIKSRLNKYNVITDKFAEDTGIKVTQNINSIPAGIRHNINGDSLANIFIKDITESFNKNIVSYLNTVDALRSINKQYPICLGIWGCSPWDGTRAIIFEYLRSVNIKTAGSQHGCLFGEAFIPWQFNTDFNRCDYFFSYGFTKNDLKKLYPEKKINIDVLPFGKVNIIPRKRKRQAIDILFPVTNTLSMLQGGIVRTPPDRLTRIQIEIISYLDSIDGINAYVKPFMNSTVENCSVFTLLNKVKRLKVVYDMKLDEFLQIYSPRAVVIEFPSQPLVEVIHLNTEIFLLSDPINPYAEDVLELLKKRVHYFDSTEGLIAALDLFLNGTLEKKRDNSYMNHYVCKDNTKENILKSIYALIEKNE
ncbi:hypothetical protein [Candidatus Magnetominusculus xianensis]|uniref:Uncharacterized protein n=1 Tax=Candidatus Magnetominusculus xianensis TaxID=1748249 RepID=A0ABR5SII0_9BACT|nr:hypothetical protein [Candidatus Magnetominusculus xianensis]KWT91063.1 hypothetical protein ASN18_0887 [Candidatus Magnetominusculus xianensis]MBF0403291.1 hypothetical protein [Nitrospirota bacterium]